MKKVLSLVLALVMVLGMTTVAFAKTDYVANYTAEEVGKSSDKMLKLMWLEDYALYGEGDKLKVEKDLTVPGDPDAIADDFGGHMYNTATNTDIRAYIMVKVSEKDVAENKFAKVIGGYTFVTKQQVNKWDVEVALAGTSSTWSKVAIAYKGEDMAHVKFEYQDYLDSLSKKQSKDTVNLKADGNSLRSGKVEITTNYKNAEVETQDKDDDEIALDDDVRVLKPKHSIAKAWIELDYEAVITTRFFEGKKIYAVVKEPVSDLHMALIDKFGFAFNRTLTQIGLNIDASTINFNESGTWVYAIDKSGNYDPVADSVKLVYVGRGDANLPIYEDYFFSLKELTLETEAPAEEPPVEGGEAPVDNNPPGGPVDNAPNNNYNPGTGR